MFTSFSTALSALNAHSTAVDVVGNNLANLNTPGYKTSVAYFRDLVTQSLGAGLGETQVGFGTAQPLTIRQFTQGAIQASTGLLDAAIQGDGFFVLRNSQDNVVYTRSGNFQVDTQGRLLSNTGERVQGWNIDTATGAVDTNGTVGDIMVPVGSIKSPLATKEMTLDLNLNAAALPNATSTYSTPVSVYDSMGTEHVLTMSFQKTDVNTWQYDVYIPGDDLDGGNSGNAVRHTGRYWDAGIRRSGGADNACGRSPHRHQNRQAEQRCGRHGYLLEPVQQHNNNAPRLTQFGQPSSPSANWQNGSGAAQLVRVGLADGGLIVAQYSNGQQVNVGQVAIAGIRNPESLIAVGNNNFQVSARTASPAIGLPATGGRGSVIGGSIEYSTVDIAREFTNLIVLQRGYQANSRVITTEDELSQETINLKR